MPWMYCEECKSEIKDWREGLRGCDRCGWKRYDLDDPDAMEIIDNIIYEVDELTEKVKYLDQLEEWLWGKHHRQCPHRDKSERRGMGDGCNQSISHGCSRRGV